MILEIKDDGNGSLVLEPETPEEVKELALIFELVPEKYRLTFGALHPEHPADDEDGPIVHVGVSLEFRT